MPAYVINDMEVTDPDLLEEYKKLSPATVQRFGGRFPRTGRRARGRVAAEAARHPRMPIALAGPGRKLVALGAIRKGPVRRVLAVSSSWRSPALPDGPTIDESGFADFRVEAPYYIMVSSATPDDVSLRIEDVVGEALLANAVLVALQMSAAEGEAWRLEQRHRWATLIRIRGIVPE